MHPEEIPNMPFRPQTLAYRIRRLTDAGILTVDQLATACGITRSTVDKILAGAAPSRQTEHSIIRVLSYHAKRLHLKLEPEESPRTADPVRSRGVFEDMDAFSGTTVFNVYDEAGKRIGIWESPVGITDEQLLVAFDDLIIRRATDRMRITPLSGEASPASG